jgi:glycosyltransferase involved in cell wall biosynthesis
MIRKVGFMSFIVWMHSRPNNKTHKTNLLRSYDLSIDFPWSRVLVMVTKLGVFVGEDNWTFFHDIYASLNAQYQIEIFKQQTVNTPLLHGRLNRWMYQNRIQSIRKNSDACFFEWASDLLAAASHMPRHGKIITRLHSFELYEWASKINWDAVDTIIVLSHFMANQFSEQFPEQRKKVSIVNNGVSLEKFSPAGRREFTFTMGMLGSIVPIKRVYEAILTVSKLVKRGYPACLHLAGAPEGDYRYAVAVHQLVEKLALKDHVFFDGFVSDTPAWLHQIDIFVSNSFWEGQQTALIEALASGCYCLAHCWAGSEEMLPGSNLYITEDELVEKIIEYSLMPPAEKKVAQMGMRAIAVEKFDIENTKREIIQVIEQSV